MKAYCEVLVNILLVTEKCSQNEAERDGGARLVESLQRAFKGSLSIMQFGPKPDPSSTWHFDYPFPCANRFERRLANASFIAQQVKAVENAFTHVIYIHLSMQFGLADLSLNENISIWTFPMFLTPSYAASGETVPSEYFKAESIALAASKNILTPSHLEKRQLIEYYSVPAEHIHVVPRGIDTCLLDPKVRILNGPPSFCSIGSIKPQKNILGLIRLFAKVCVKFPEATLRIIGPVQNSNYCADVCAEIKHLGLENAVGLAGYVPPSQLPMATQDAHLHLSASTCETFGRAIFETLALGLPNVARKTGNASAEFLEDLPYAQFTDSEDEALKSIEQMLANLAPLSSLAQEIGTLYDDEILSRLLIAKICSNDSIGISDFDGTLYHKDNAEKTLKCINAFRQFPLRILCSARPIPDLLNQLQVHQLEVDWIVGCSGSIVANGHGKPLWLTPLDSNDVAYLQSLVPQATSIEVEGKTLQLTAPAQVVPPIFGFRTENYQGIAFISHSQASKLRAVHRLLSHIQWNGQVRAFGDGRYDTELLTYFDGVLFKNGSKCEFS